MYLFSLIIYVKSCNSFEFIWLSCSNVISIFEGTLGIFEFIWLALRDVIFIFKDN